MPSDVSSSSPEQVPGVELLTEAAAAQEAPRRKGQGKGGGHPKFAPTEFQRGEVKGMAMCGLPHHDMAVIVGIDTKTLLKYFQPELQAGKAMINARVMRRIAKEAAAEDGDIRASFWWASTQMGMAGADAKTVAAAVANRGDVSRASRAEILKSKDPVYVQKTYLELMGGGKGK